MTSKKKNKKSSKKVVFPSRKSTQTLDPKRKKFTKLLLISAELKKGDAYHLELNGDEMLLARTIAKLANEDRRFRKIVTLAINLSMKKQ